MLGLTQGRDAVRRDIGDAIDLLTEIDPADWDLPTRLEGWSVRDLGRHLAYGQELQAEGWSRLRRGEDEPTDPTTISSDDPDEILTAIQDQHERFLAELDAVDEADLARGCPMPYGTLPGAVVLQVAAMEAGVHRSDLEDALGRNETHLEPDTLDAIFTILPGSLPQLAMAATERPGPGTGIQLAPSDGATISLRVGGSGWEAADAGAPTDFAYTISGDPAPVALFALGRIPANHESLTIEGDIEMAKRFKVHFPGP